jgi:hypothetical protein
VVLKDGWLNRQFDEVSKNVNAWPEWMKRAARLEENKEKISPPQTASNGISDLRRGKPVAGQQRLSL